MKNPLAKIPLEIVAATVIAIAILFGTIWLFRSKPDTKVDAPKSATAR